MTSDETAAALLASRTPALLQVWCLRESHNIANVYALPGGAVLAVRGWRMRSEDWNEGRRHPGGRVWAASCLYAINGDLAIPARCRCGGQLIGTTDVADALACGRRRLRARRSFNPDD